MKAKTRPKEKEKKRRRASCSVSWRMLVPVATGRRGGRQGCLAEVGRPRQDLPTLGFSRKQWIPAVKSSSVVEAYTAVLGKARD